MAFCSCFTTCSNVWQSQLWRIVIQGGPTAVSVTSSTSGSGVVCSAIALKPRGRSLHLCTWGPHNSGPPNPPSECAGGAQRRDACRLVAEKISQHFVGVLPQLRCWRGRGDGSGRLHRRGDLAQRAALRMLHLDHHLTRENLLVGERFR